MKKNFFKKLALVMALTLTVTSIPANSASAAAKPGFKSTAVKVNVDQTKKYSTANSAKYSVNFKIGNKSVATIKYSKGSKSVKVTGVAAGKTTLRADFKSYKTKKVTTAKVPVTVAEVATTLKSVEAKGVRTLVATFSKAVDDTKAEIAVTKGTAKVSVASTKWADDKKSVTLTTSSKLTEGTYTVSVSKLTEAALTGDVTVKDEALTSIEVIGSNLVSKEATPTIPVDATIGFKTLNQYGERMAGANISPSSSFGSITDIVDCTANRNGKLTITINTQTLAIYGTTGSLTIVDRNTGINTTATVTFSEKAAAKTMTIAGLYNSAESKIATMSKGDTVSNYSVLATVEDQYGNALSAKDITDGTLVTSTLVPGLSNVGATGSWSDVTVDGKDYVALSLTAGTGTKAEIGTFYLTFVSPRLGLLANTSFTVSDGTVIKSLSIYSNSGIYKGDKNTLTYEAVDASGNAITKYDVLSELVQFTGRTPSEIGFVKQSDGTAKLVYNPAITIPGGNGNKSSVTDYLTIGVNKQTTTNYFVKQVTLKVYEARELTEVTGVKASAYTAVAFGNSVKLAASDLIVEDQYGNVLPASKVKEHAAEISVTATGGAITVAQANMGTNTDKDITLAAAAASSASKNDELTTIKFSITSSTTKTLDYEKKFAAVDPARAIDLAIKSVNSGDVVYGDYTMAGGSGVKAGQLAVGNVVVTGKVNNRTLKIPTSEYVISGDAGKELGIRTDVGNSTKTETAKVEVTVATNNGSVVVSKEYTYSNAAATITTIDEKDLATNYTLVSGTANGLKAIFDFTDQYGKPYTGTELNSVKYNVVDTRDLTDDIKFNNTNSVNFTMKTTEYVVTATFGSATCERTVASN